MRSKDPATLRIIDIWGFTSTKSNKRYIVEIEHFSKHFLGIKFYWKGVSDSKNRYSLLTNDYEPRTIIMSCIHIMLDYFINDKCSSFGFVAANNINETSSQFKPNKRFRFYRRMMLSIFGEQTFTQVYDKNSSLYVLINSKMLRDNLVTIHQIEHEIGRLYSGEYSLQL